MRKQAWLYLNLGILSILFLGWMGNSAEAATAHIAQPQNGSCTNESTIVLRVEIDSGKEDVKIVKFWLDQSAPIEQGNNPSWGREPGPWDFSRDVVRPDEPVWWYYETEWNVSGMSDHNYSLTYWLIDRNGKTIYFGETVAFGSDRTIPGGSITAPSNGQTITGDKIHITASASDNLCGVDWVKFLVHTPNERKGSKNSQWSGSDGDFWFSYTDYSSPWSPPDWDMTGIPDGEVMITIWVDDRAGNRFMQPENERVKVYVNRNASISGTVRDKVTQAPIGGATVRLEQSDVIKYTTNTDSNGRYQIDNVTPGNYRLVALKLDTHQNWFQDITLSAGQHLTKDIEMTPLNAKVSGQVRDKVTQAPLSGATVRLEQSDVIKYTTTTDSNGRYQIDNVTPGNYRLVALKLDTHQNWFQDITLSAGQHLTKDIEMTPLNAKVSGQVRDKMTQAPIGGATIRLEQSDVIKYTTTTDSNGQYQIENITPGDYRLVALKLETHQNWFQDIILSAGQHLTKDIEMPPLEIPNLQPYQPPDWDNEIVVSSTPGDHKATPVYAGQPIYFDYAFINNSDVDITTSFQTYLYIDGFKVDSKTTSSLSAHSYDHRDDFQTTLSAGEHLIKMVVDATEVIAESNEGDNVYEMTIVVNKLVPRFLTLPLATQSRVVNGWYYSKTHAPIGTIHYGIDYEAAYDDLVVASADGVAMTSSQYASGSGYGKFVLIRHDEVEPSSGLNYFTLYAHINRAAPDIKVYPESERGNTNYDEWTPVQRGQVIGYVGHEDTSWDHLHFEINKGGYAQNKTDPYDLYKETTAEHDSAEYYPPYGPLYTSCGPNYLWTQDPPIDVKPITPDISKVKLSSGIWFTPPPIYASTGPDDHNIAADFYIINNNASAITLQQVTAAVLDSAGAHLFDLSSDTDVSIAAGATYHYEQSGYVQQPGNYKAMARYKYDDTLYDIPKGPGTTNPYLFEVLQKSGSILEKVSGDNQYDVVGKPLPNPLVVKVLDDKQTPMQGVTVNFTVTEGGSVNPTQATTDVNGKAQTILSLGAQPGYYKVTATVEELEKIVFTAMAIDSYEHDNDSAKAKTIEPDIRQTHNIAPVGDVDWVKFNLSQPSDIILETSGVSGGDTVMWLYNSSLTQIGYNDNRGDAYSRILLSGLPVGTYYLEIREKMDDHEIERYYIDFHTSPPTSMPDFTYMSYSMIDEVDGHITAGDHVHLNILFKNNGSGTAYNVHVEFIGYETIGDKPGIQFSALGISWGRMVDVGLGDVAPGKTVNFPIWIYVENIDYAQRKSVTGTKPYFEIRYGDKPPWKISVSLEEPIYFPPPAEQAYMTADDCLHHPNDDNIKKYAQYAAGHYGNPGDYDSNPNSRDPDVAERAAENVIEMVARDFYPGYLHSDRTPDTQLLVERRYGVIGECRNYADLTTGLLRSIGFPTRLVLAKLPRAGHAWNEIYIDGNWEHLDSTAQSVGYHNPKKKYDGTFNENLYATDCYGGGAPKWAYAAKVPLPNRIIQNAPACDGDCYYATSDEECDKCSGFWKGLITIIDFFDLFKGCWEEVTDKYSGQMVSYSHNPAANSKTEQILSLSLDAPYLVVQNNPFVLSVYLTNNGTTVQQNITVTVGIKQYVDNPSDQYFTDNPQQIVESIEPGQTATLTWEITPIVYGNLIPLSVFAESEYNFAHVVLLQNINEPGTLLDLALDSSTQCYGNETIVPGDVVTFSAIVFDEMITPVTDATVSAAVSSVASPEYEPIVTLTYNADSETYLGELSLPADALIGEYNVEFTASKDGYDPASVSRVFHVSPALSVTASADKEYYVGDTMVILSADVLDREAVIDDASVIADVETPAGNVSIPLRYETDKYIAMFQPIELLPSLGVTEFPAGTWHITVNAEYYGGKGSDEIDIATSECFYTDVNCDNLVDIVDIQLIANHWNTREGEPGYDAKYDIDNYGQGDGVIDIIDIQLAANRWNTEAPFVAPTIPLSPAISPVTVYLNAHPHPSSPSKGEGNMVNLCNALTVDLVADRPINIQALELHLTYDVNRLSLQQADIPAFKAIVQDSQNLVMLLGPSVDESTGILAYGGIVLDKKGTAGVLPKNFIDSSKFYLGSIKNMSYGDFREKEQAVSPVLASLQFIAQQTGTTAIELTDLKIIDTEGYLIPVTVQNQAHVKIAPPPPKSSALAQNYPNPFNPETWIPFKLSSDSHVEINIYNVKGQVVKTLDLGVKEAGYYMDKTSAAHWDGRLKTGERVASGLYFYTIKAGKFIATRRMVMVK